MTFSTLVGTPAVGRNSRHALPSSQRNGVVGNESAIESMVPDGFGRGRCGVF
jgi:hypothetical protein